MDKRKKIIFEIWRLEEEWETHCKPGYTGISGSFGMMSFDNYHRWPLHKLAYVVSLSEKKTALKKELRKLIGWRQYLYFTFAPLHYLKSI